MVRQFPRNSKRLLPAQRALWLTIIKRKVKLLDCWGPWCPACVEGIPHVQAQHTKFRNRGLVVIGIHTGWGTEKKLDTFLKDRHITFPVVVDSDFAIADLHKGKTAH